MILTSRDLELFLNLQSYGMLTTKQIESLVFRGTAVTTILRRLRALESDGNIKRASRIDGGEIIWMLTNLGGAKIGKDVIKRHFRSDTLVSKKIFKCEPHRVLAKRVELLIWQELVKFLTEPDFLKIMLNEVKALYEGDPSQREADRLKAKLYGMNSQIEAMAERLTLLPKSISAVPVFKQMEKLEIAKKEIEESLAKVKKQPINFEQRIVKVQTFQAFAENYRKFIKNADHEVKKQMVQKFIKKVEIGVDEVKIHWNLDQEHYERELALRGRSAEGQVFLINVGSYSLTIGAQVAGVDEPLLPSQIPDEAFFSTIPDWVCEVLSPSTAALDRARKMPFYAQSGVKHFWLVDPIAKSLEVYENDHGRWVVVHTYMENEKARAAPFDAIEIDLSTLWI